jgi:hypothetical protein
MFVGMVVVTSLTRFDATIWAEGMNTCTITSIDIWATLRIRRFRSRPAEVGADNVKTQNFTDTPSKVISI